MGQSKVGSRNQRCLIGDRSFRTVNKDCGGGNLIGIARVADAMKVVQ